MGTEGGFTIRPYMPETGEQRRQAERDHLQEEREERQRRIALYQAFKDSPLHPAYARIYYPGCGSDDAVVTAFPESEVHLVDIDKKNIATLQKRQHAQNVHVVEASVTDYEPGPVDILVIHGADFGMKIDKAIHSVIEGGFMLSGDDAGTEQRDALLRRPDLELVGILRPAEESDKSPVAGMQQEVHRGVAGVSPEFHFEEGRREHAELVENDDEFQRAHPALFRNMQRQWEATKAYSKQPVPESVLAFAKKIRSVPIPPKEPGAALWIFRKRTQDVSTEPVTNDRMKFLQHIFALDQSDPGRIHASECHQQLIERQGDFLGTPEEAMYWDALSREALHLCQIEAGKEDRALALQWVQMAMDYASRVPSGFYSFDWINYLRGTEAYLRGDVEALASIAPHCDANKKVIESLLRGLKSRGSPSYTEDYGS